MTYNARFRTEGGFSAIQNAVNYQTYPVSDTNRTWTAPVYGAGYPNGTYREMSDVVDSEYFTKRKRGEAVFYPMQSYRRTASVTGGGLEYRQTVPQGSAPQYLWAGRLVGDEFGALVASVLSGGYLPPGLISDADIDDLASEVSTDVWAEVGTTRTQLLEDVAEFNTTLNMFRSPAASLFKWANRFDSNYYALSKRRKSLVNSRGHVDLSSGAGRDFVQGVSALYLEARYGLKPIVSSIVGTLEELNRVAVNTDDLWTTRKKADIMKSNSLHPVEHVRQVGQSIVTLSVASSHTVAVRGMSMDIVKMTLSRRLGFNLTRVPATMWNLTTLSFVADWFGNIGSYISAMTPSLDVRNRGTCLSILDERESVITVKGCVGVGTCVVTSPLRGSGSISTRRYDRGPLRPPKLLVRQDWGFSKPARIVDAVALVAQRLPLLAALVKSVPGSVKGLNFP